jgi:dihydroorotase
MGTTGLETAFASVYTDLVIPGVLALSLVVEKLTAGGGLLGLEVPTIAPAAPADLVLVDLDAEWTVGEHGYESRSANCCFDGRTLRGKIALTVAAGAVAFRERVAA